MPSRLQVLGSCQVHINQFSQIPNFTGKLKFYHWWQMLSVDRRTFFISEVTSVKYRVGIAIACHFFLSSKTDILWGKTKQLVYLACRSHVLVFSQPLYLCIRKMFRPTTHLITQYKGFIVKVYDFIKLINFAALLRMSLGETGYFNFSLCRHVC